MADEFCIDNVLLISSVQQRPVLWEKSLELYKNRVATEKAWKEIMTVLHPNIELREERTRRAYGKLIIQRWTHIRDNYHRSCKKIREQKMLGTKKSKPYVYSKQLSFLQKIFDSNDNLTESYIKTENHEDDDEDNESNQQDNDQWNITFIDTNTLPTKNLASKRPSKSSLESNDNLEAKIIKFMDTYAQGEPKITNRHLSFFKGILPTLDDFDENEVIEFQMGVLQLLKQIKTNRQSNNLKNLFV